MFASSAPGESPPPVPRNTQGTASDIRPDVLNTQTMVFDIHPNMLKSQEGADGQNQPVSVTRAVYHRIRAYRHQDPKQVSDLNHQQAQYLIFASSIPSESPPPVPRARFGPGELIEKVVGLVRNLIHLPRWCRWDREDDRRSNCPPQRSCQTAVWQQPLVHSL